MNKLKVFILSVLAVIFGSCSNAQDNKKNVSNSNSENMEGNNIIIDGTKENNGFQSKCCTIF